MVRFKTYLACWESFYCLIIDYVSSDYVVTNIIIIL